MHSPNTIIKIDLQYTGRWAIMATSDDVFSKKSRTAWPIEMDILQAITPEDIIRDSYVLNFFGLGKNTIF